MDLSVVVVMLFYGAVIEGKEFLQTGRGDAIGIPEDKGSPEGGQSQVLALLILEGNEDSETNEASHKTTKFLPLTGGLQPHRQYTDSSGESNSDEYADSETSADTDSESNYYHEEDYQKDIQSNRIDVSDLIQDRTAVLRKRWRSCQKKASKVCRQACSASYKNACDMTKCKSKLKKNMKKECKRNCKDYFM